MFDSNKLADPSSLPTERAETAEEREAALGRGLDRAAGRAAVWRARAGVAAANCVDRWLLHVPDVGPTCEVLLADRLFHDLSPAERDGLLAYVRGAQDPSGAWLDAYGEPDLSLTALGWWARRDAGDDPAEESMVLAQRVVHRMGGAQRASFAVRLWLAMGGQIPWAWLPAIPSELFLLPPHLVLSPSRFSPWARGVLTPYLLIARAPAHLQLADATALLLPHNDGQPMTPRLTRPGLAGDLLQVFDRGVKLARKLPRGPLPAIANRRALAWLDEHQQAHGGWFSLRPTLLSLVALRVMGASCDDPRLRRGLDHLRSGRGIAIIPHGAAAGETAMAQGLGGPSLDVIARLLRCGDHEGTLDNDGVQWLLSQQLEAHGPWQARADAASGGWPHEPAASHHLDVDSTCAVIETLTAVAPDSPHVAEAWASTRRAIDVLFAMQEPDGRFSRFERGESEVLMRRLPWTDADLLAYGRPDDVEHLRVTARVLACLADAGFGTDDDRVARGMAWLRQTLTARMHEEISAGPLQGVATLARTLGLLCPAKDGLRREFTSRLRARQREDGSFGAVDETAYALQALVALGITDVQAQRAAHWLANLAANDSDRRRDPTDGEPTERARPVVRGLGLSPTGFDPSAGPRETVLALRAYQAAGGR